MIDAKRNGTHPFGDHCNGSLFGRPPGRAVKQRASCRHDLAAYGNGSGSKLTQPHPRDKPRSADQKPKVETALSAASIAAIIVQASRDQYHATGRPCACPDDTARNGSSCGGRSAYSRPGGAEPLCYPTDVTPAMIEKYRQKIAPR